MKKLPLLIVLSAIAFGSFAQEQKAAALHSPTQKDNKLAGANLLLLCDPDGRGVGQSHGYTHPGINPHYGYFILDNLAIGIDLKVSMDDRDHNRKTLYPKFGAFGRYYPGKAVRRNGTINKLRPFVDAGAAYGRMSFIADDYTDAYMVFDLHIMPGINYFLTPRMALELGLNGIVEKTDYPGSNFIFSPNLGLQFFFAGRR